MYKIKKPNLIFFYKNIEIANKIGISASTLSRILNGKQATQKTTAYCIVKTFNPEKEVEDYFKKITRHKKGSSI
jgi:DNA-binding XRE family transcriptional regulator